MIGSMANHTRPPRFLIAADPSIGDRIPLPPGEAKHARVRRLRLGDPVVLFDGKGAAYRGVIATREGPAVEVLIEQRLPDFEGEAQLRLTLAVAVLKADRLDWVIEKSTELGVARIRPFTCTRSLAMPSPARRNRWRHIALSAAKQSDRSVVPAVEEPIAFAAILIEREPCRILFAEGTAKSGLPHLAAPPRQVTAVIGPEGGWTPAELESAQRAGLHRAGLGPRILRAETAAITAVALCQAIWGDMGRSRHPARKE